jgi:Uma2 family endonuclease
MTKQTEIEPRVHIWTKGEYYLMAEFGLLAHHHVELIEGRVIEMSPIGSQHVTAVTLASEALRKAFGQDYHVRIQAPFDAGELSEPEPDIAVVAGSARDYLEAHPSHAALLVEVADSSLSYDRLEKASLYAKAGIQEYWIINLKQAELEVYRKPISDPSQIYGYGYAALLRLSHGERVSPLSAHATVAVADLLP